jgi:hypothetical protein
MIKKQNESRKLWVSISRPNISDKIVNVHVNLEE